MGRGQMGWSPCHGSPFWACGKPAGQRASLHIPLGSSCVPSWVIPGLGLGGRSPEDPRMNFQGKRLSPSCNQGPAKPLSEFYWWINCVMASGLAGGWAFPLPTPPTRAL